MIEISFHNAQTKSWSAKKYVRKKARETALLANQVRGLLLFQPLCAKYLNFKKQKKILKTVFGSV